MMVLDLGCGRGRRTFELKREHGANSQIFGIDIEKENIKKARDKFGKECKFILAKGEKIPFENNLFDLAYSEEVLEHVMNLNRTIKEVVRILKKSGIFIVTFPNEESEKELIKFNKNYLKQIGHKRIINLEGFEKIIKEYFDIREIKVYNSIEHLYWRILFKRGYKIISENGDLNKSAPRLLKLFENVLNPDKTFSENDKKIYKFVKILNKVFSPISRIFDLLFTKKRIKIILIKK